MRAGVPLGVSGQRSTSQARPVRSSSLDRCCAPVRNAPVPHKRQVAGHAQQSEGEAPTCASCSLRSIAYNDEEQSGGLFAGRALSVSEQRAASAGPTWRAPDRASAAHPPALWPQALPASGSQHTGRAASSTAAATKAASLSKTAAPKPRTARGVGSSRAAAPPRSAAPSSSSTERAAGLPAPAPATPAAAQPAAAQKARPAPPPEPAAPLSTPAPSPAARPTPPPPPPTPSGDATGSSASRTHGQRSPGLRDAKRAWSAWQALAAVACVLAVAGPGIAALQRSRLGWQAAASALGARPLWEPGMVLGSSALTLGGPGGAGRGGSLRAAAAPPGGASSGGGGGGGDVGGGSAIPLVAVVAHDAPSPYKGATWGEVMSHTAQRLLWTDARFRLTVFSQDQLKVGAAAPAPARAPPELRSLHGWVDAWLQRTPPRAALPCVQSGAHGPPLLPCRVRPGARCCGRCWGVGASPWLWVWASPTRAWRTCWRGPAPGRPARCSGTAARSCRCVAGEGAGGGGAIGPEGDNCC